MRIPKVWILNVVCVIVTIGVTTFIDAFIPTALIVLPLCAANIIAALFDNESRSY